MVSKYKYTPPLMKKVIGNYFGLNPLYKGTMLRVWDLTVKVTSWVVRILKKLKLKPGVPFCQKWKPGLCEENATTTYALKKVFILQKDLMIQKIVGLVYECRQINGEFTPKIVEKGFWVGDLKDQSQNAICE
jgi:hypothetical protein